MSARSSESLLSRLEHFGMRLGLSRARKLLEALGDPHLAVPRILVAGTNGKGSTSALLDVICRTAGYRTGLYTSPHLEAVTERIQVDHNPIEDRQLAAILERILDLARDLELEPPTYFEALTLAAFLQFRDAAVDLAVMEVGLGGRLDATNVGTPDLSIISSIALDHERHLGESRESVAKEKAGILRQGRPAIAWSTDSGVTRVLGEEATAVGAELAFADPDNVSFSTPPGTNPQRVHLETPVDAYDLELHLPGRHQLANLSLAVRAAEILRARGWRALDRDVITRGVAHCRWPGRLEWVELPDGRRVLLDAAHNAAGIEALIDYLGGQDERPDLLFGALAEKTIDGVLPQLAAVVGRVVLTQPPNERSATPERWSQHFTGRPVHLETDPQRALEDSLAACDSTLLVCGSLFLVGRVRGLLRRRFGVPSSLGS